jgi:D-alanyl-D-alanine dipeptidase
MIANATVHTVMMRLRPARLLVATVLSATALALPAQTRTLSPPAPPPAKWVGLIGEYDAPAGMRIVREDSGRLEIADTGGHVAPLRAVSNRFRVDRSAAEHILGRATDAIAFGHDATGRSTAMVAGGVRMLRRNIEPRAGTNQLRITPLRPVKALRAEALAASPPRESGTFKPSDLVELTTLDPTIKLEIRYATTNNFLGTRFYDQARAFLQRPAANAVVRANAALHRLGYGILVHDAYRPWYVTKMFWDATPPAKRWLVADPAHGSRHNRGAAVDLTLYDLKTGRPVAMPSTYDESTDRAFADYPGGTSRQRWYRSLLRREMEAQGFTVNPQEWWHFDYRDWQSYAIGNVPFEKIGLPRR